MRLIVVAIVFALAAFAFSTQAFPFGQAPATAPAEDGRLNIVYPGGMTRDAKAGAAVTVIKGKGKTQASIAEEGKDYKIIFDICTISEKKQLNPDTKKDELRQYGSFEGNLKFANPTTTVTATKALADFSEGKITFNGNVKVISRQREAKPEVVDSTLRESKAPPAKSGATAAAGPGSAAPPAKEAPPPPKNNPTVLTCEQFEFDYDERQGTATGKLSITQDKRKATAERALFDDVKNIVTLLGNVDMEESRENQEGKPDKLKVIKIVIDVDAEQWDAEEGTADLVIKRNPKKGADAKAKATESKTGADAKAKAGESKSGEAKKSETKN